MIDSNSNQNNSNSEPSSRPDKNDIEELTSYLDGELSPVQMQAVEKRLSRDEHYRGEMQRLQKAWDMLDRLPRADSSAQFTKSTIEMVVQNAKFDVRKKKNLAFSWLARVALLAALPLAAFGSSQMVTQHIQNAPQRKLAKDLPVIENVDVYLKADSIDFISGLTQLELFDDVSVFEIDPDLGAFPARETVTFTQLKQLDVQELDELRKKRKRFYDLPLQTQESLRKFRQQLDQREDADALASTMLRYYSWLKGLDEDEVIALLDLPVGQRIERTRELVNKRASDLFGKTSATELPEEDASAVYDWIKRTQTKYMGEVIKRYQRFDEEEKALIRQGGPRRSEGVNPKERQAMWRAVTKVDPQFVGDLVFREIEQLRSQLSDKAILIIDRYEGEDQRKLVLNWIVTAIQAEQHVSDATLMQFYENELPPEMRDNFGRMTPGTFREQLLLEYYRSRQFLELPPSGRREMNGDRDPPTKKKSL